jgi:parvulin-like peptidyl-prolyl isomerase
LQKEVEDAIFSLEPGQIYPEPVRSSLGYHIVQTLERVNDRPLSQAALAEKKQQAFLNWLDSQRQSAVIERFVGVGS